MEDKKLTHSNISIIAAMSPNHIIGCNGSLPWHIPEDLAHFKKLTWGHTIIMGRKTFFSLPNGALPGRRNIVISKTLSHLKGCEVYNSLQKALEALCIDDDIFIIGGASIYTEALPLASCLFITLIDKEPAHGDTFFPIIDRSKWIETNKEKHDGFSFITFKRCDEL